MSLEVPSGHWCCVLGRFLLKMTPLSVSTDASCTCSSSCQIPSGQFTALSLEVPFGNSHAFLQRFLLKATPLRVHTLVNGHVLLNCSYRQRLPTSHRAHQSTCKSKTYACTVLRPQENVSRGWKMKSQKFENNDARKP